MLAIGRRISTFLSHKQTDKKQTHISKTKRFVLFVLLFALLASFLPGFNSNQAHALTPIIGEKDQSKQIQSYLYAEAMTECFYRVYDSGNPAESNQSGFTIKYADVIAHKWFEGESGGSASIKIGMYITDTNVSKSNDGKTSCAFPQFVQTALSLWGMDNETDIVDLLCNVGYVRRNNGDSNAPSPQTVTQCKQGGSTGFTLPYGGGNTTISANQMAQNFTNYIQTNIYQGNPIALTSPQLYLLHLGEASNSNSCIPGISSTPPNSSGTSPGGALNYDNVTWIDTTNLVSVTGWYTGRMPGTDSISFWSRGIAGGQMFKCSAVVQGITDHAADFLAWLKLNPDAIIQGPTNGSTGPDNSCGGQVSGIGWIVCPVLNALTGLNDMMWKLVSYLLTTNPLDQSSSIYTAWEAIRNIANVVFVIFFLVVIYSQLTGGGMSNYGVKKMLPRLIITAILVNVSFIICQIAVDLANIVGNSLYDFLRGLSPGFDFNWSGLLTDIAGIGVGGTIVGVATLAAGGLGALFFMILPFVLIAALGFLTAMLTLIFRQAVIPVLVILSPLAFVAYLLPNTESWFKKWRDLLMSMLMMFPLAAAVFGGALIAGEVIYNNGGFWSHLIGMTVAVVPLFSLPFIARQGGSILKGVSGALNKATVGLRKPITQWAGNRAEESRTNVMSEKPGDLAQRRWPSRLGRSAYRGMKGRAIARQERIDAGQTEFKSQVHNDQIQGPLGGTVQGRAAAVRLDASKEQSRIDSTNITGQRIRENYELSKRGSQADEGLKQVKEGEKEMLHSDTSLDALRSDTEEATLRSAGAVDRSKERTYSPANPNYTRLRNVKAESTNAQRGAETAVKRMDTDIIPLTDTAETALRRAQTLGKAAEARQTAQIAPNLYDAKVEEMQATNEQKIAEEKVSSGLKEAASGANQADLVAAGSLAAGLGQVTRDQLFGQEKEIKVETSRTGSAQSVQNQNMAEYLAGTSDEAKADVIRAGGIGNGTGQARVVAQAQSTQERFEQENIGYSKDALVRESRSNDELTAVTASGFMPRLGTTDGKEIAKLVSEGWTPNQIEAEFASRGISLPPATLEQQRAAIEIVGSSGDKGKMEMILNGLGAAATDPDGRPNPDKLKKLTQTYYSVSQRNKWLSAVTGIDRGKLSAGQLPEFSGEYQKAVDGGKITSADVGALSAMPVLQQMAVGKMSAGKMSAEDWIGLDDTEGASWDKALANDSANTYLTADPAVTKKIVDTMREALIDPEVSRRLNPLQKKNMTAMLGKLGWDIQKDYSKPEGTPYSDLEETWTPEPEVRRQTLEKERTARPAPPSP